MRRIQDSSSRIVIYKWIIMTAAVFTLLVRPGNSVFASYSVSEAAEVSAGQAVLPGSGAESAASGLPADGTYEEPAFSFSGGSGKLTISCRKVVVEGGQAKAQLVFSSSHITYVKADGVRYDTVPENGTSVTPLFPVTLDREMEIAAQTVAMSEPHEITYHIYVSLGKSEEGAAIQEGEPGEDRLLDPQTENLQAKDPQAENPQTENLQPENPQAENPQTEETLTENSRTEDPLPLPRIPGLTFTERMELHYARWFAVDYADNGCRLITVREGDRYLIVPDGVPLPELTDSEEGSDLVVIRPPRRIYLANTSAMSLFAAIDALGSVSFCSLDKSGWYIPEPVEALRDGTMQYAGKYSEPDYELLVSGGCDLAVENTMLYHTPEVKEMLENLGIPVFVDRASYEEHPLGRTEWVRAYAALLGLEEEAEAFFAKQEEILRSVETMPQQGKTVAFFALSSNGTVTVRKTEDYIPNMLRAAGGIYVFDGMKELAGSGSVSISLEEFFSYAHDADYLVYNATIEEALAEARDLTAKNPLFAEFRAVQEGHVWQIEKSMYQSTDKVAAIIRDLAEMLGGQAETQSGFLTKLE